MKILSVLITCFTTLALYTTANADGFYKWIDASGNTQYGDQPPPGVNAKPIKMPAITVIENYAEQWKPLELDNDSTTDSKSQQNTSNNEANSASYDVFEFIAPKSNQAIRANDGDVSAMISVKPPLKKGHTIAFYLDGKEVSKGKSRTSNFKNLPRGEHTVSAKITDKSGRVVKSSSASFTVLRFSKLLNTNALSNPTAN